MGLQAFTLEPIHDIIWLLKKQQQKPNTNPTYTNILRR